MKAQDNTNNGLGGLPAEITETKYQPTARDLQDLADMEADLKFKEENDARMAGLFQAYLSADKHSDPSAYFAAKDALQAALEEGLRHEDRELLHGLEPIWDGEDRAKSGALIYLLEQRAGGWDLLLEKNESLAEDFVIAMIDEELSLPEARAWAEEVILLSERESRPVEEEKSCPACGCTESNPCTSRVEGEEDADVCGWAPSGCCSFCEEKIQNGSWLPQTPEQMDYLEKRAAEALDAIHNEPDEEGFRIDGVPRAPFGLVPDKFAFYFDGTIWALAEKVDTAAQKGIWVPISRYEESTAETPIPLVKSWAENEIQGL